MKWFYEHLNNFFITHLVSIFLFAICYYILLNNIDEHFIVNKELKSFYTENSILNAIFISINLESSTGYLDLITKSVLSRSICTAQLFISLIITFSSFIIKFLNKAHCFVSFDSSFLSALAAPAQAAPCTFQRIYSPE